MGYHVDIVSVCLYTVVRGGELLTGTIIIFDILMEHSSYTLNTVKLRGCVSVLRVFRLIHVEIVSSWESMKHVLSLFLLKNLIFC